METNVVVLADSGAWADYSRSSRNVKIYQQFLAQFSRLPFPTPTEDGTEDDLEQKPQRKDTR